MSDIWHHGALLQDELLFNVVHVLEGDMPLGPSFVVSLATIVDAIILHETAYYNIGWDLAGSSGGLESMVHASDFVQQLVEAGLLTRFPAREIVDANFAELGCDYNYLEFVSDQKWMMTSCCFVDSDSERDHSNCLASILRDFPGVVLSKKITNYDEQPIGRDAKRLAEAGLTSEGLLVLEGHNRQADAYVTLSRYLGLSPYLVAITIPHQIGAIERNNRPPSAGDPQEEEVDFRKMFEPRADPAPQSTSFVAVPSPLLLHRFLEELQGDLKSLVPRIAKLRDEFAPLRSELAQHERARVAATTPSEREARRLEFQRLWTAQFTEQPLARWTYELRDVAAASPETETICGQDRTIGAWWQTLGPGPAAYELQVRLASFGKRIAPSDCWEAAMNLGREIDNYCQQQPSAG